MVQPAERDRELVADLAAERPDLGEAQVMRVRGFPPADEARSGSDESDVGFVPVAPHL